MPADPITSAVGAGLGLVGGIGGIISSIGSNKRLQALMAADPTYQENPLVKSRLALATTLLNARAPGAAYQEANIYGNQAATLNNIDRNATSGSQALAVGSAAQGQTNEAFANLGNQEALDYQRRLGNYVGAEEQQVGEDDKAYQDRIRKFGDQAQITGAQNANTQNAWKSLSNLGFAGLNFGAAGGFNKTK